MTTLAMPLDSSVQVTALQSGAGWSIYLGEAQEAPPKQGDYSRFKIATDLRLINRN
jgi:hypothetical protein